MMNEFSECFVDRVQGPGPGPGAAHFQNSVPEKRHAVLEKTRCDPKSGAVASDKGQANGKPQATTCHFNCLQQG